MAVNSFNSTIAPPPLNDKFVDKEGYASPELANWILLDLLTRVQAASQTQNPMSLTGQHATIGVTALIPVANAGDYRVSWYQQVTTVDSTSMSTVVNVQSGSFGHTITQSGPAMNGNTLNTAQSGSFIARSDGGVLSFSVTLAGGGTGDGRFAIDVIAEFLG